MPSAKKFWILVRIAFAELSIIFGLFMYVLELNSVIRPLQTWYLASLFTIGAGIFLSIAEKKFRNDI